MSPGLHTLELTTVTASGTESVRSGGFSVMAESSVTTSELSTPVDENGRPPEPVCLGDGHAECYQASLVATGLNWVASLIATTGEQMLFIEGEQAIRVIEGNQLLDRAALSSESGRLLSLAVPPDVEQSHYVYVAASTPARGGNEELSITRYRELQGTLAEGATIVTGLALPSGGSAQMTMDATGLLYLSMPVIDSRSGRSTTAILRYQADGTVPSSNPQFSPVIAYGYENSSALIWDGRGNKLWLAGRNSQADASVATLRTDASPRTAWPWSPVGVALQGPPPDAGNAPRVTMTLDRGGRSRSVWFVSVPGMVYRGRVQDDRQLPLAPVTFGAIADVATVVGGPDASLVLVSESAQSPTHVSQIWRLDRIVPKMIKLS